MLTHFPQLCWAKLADVDPLLATDRVAQQTHVDTHADTDAHSFSLVLSSFPFKQHFCFAFFPLCEGPAAFADLWFVLLFVAQTNRKHCQAHLARAFDA